MKTVLWYILGLAVLNLMYYLLVNYFAHLHGGTTVFYSLAFATYNLIFNFVVIKSEIAIQTLCALIVCLMSLLITVICLFSFKQYIHAHILFVFICMSLLNILGLKFIMWVIEPEKLLEMETKRNTL